MVRRFARWCASWGLVFGLVGDAWGSDLTVDAGSDANDGTEDLFSVWPDSVTINGTTNIPLAGVSALTILGSSDADVVHVFLDNGPLPPLGFWGGDGADQFVVHGTSEDDVITHSPPVLGPLTLDVATPYGLTVVGASAEIVIIEGQGGSDQFVFTEPDTASTIIVARGGEDGDRLTLIGNATGNVFGLQFSGGDGNDNVEVLAGGGLSVAGGNDDDAIRVVGTSDADEFDLEQIGVRISRVGSPDIQTSSVEDYTLETGDGNDTIASHLIFETNEWTLTILAGADHDVISVDGSLPLDDSLQVDAGTGDDQVNLTLLTLLPGPSISPKARVDGNEGEDSLYVTGTAGPDSIALFGDRIRLPGGEDLEHLGMENMTFSGDDGADGFVVDAGPALLSSVTVNGGDGTDELSVNGSHDADQAEATAISFEREGSPRTSWAFVEDVAVNLFDGADTLTLLGDVPASVVFDGGDPSEAPGDTIDTNHFEATYLNFETILPPPVDVGWLEKVQADLGITLSSGDHADFLDQLEDGVPRETVALQILQTTEYRTVLVEGWYDRYLGRTPTTTEVDTAIGLLASGSSQQAVLATLLTTAEYFPLPINDRSGQELKSYATRLYADLLGRPGSANEVALGSVMVRHYGRAALAAWLQDSAEYRNGFVQDAYARFLGRAASTAEAQDHVAQMWTPLSAEGLYAHLLGLPEYAP